MELVAFVFKGLGYCGFEAPGISRFGGIHHCDEGIIVSIAYLKESIGNLLLNESFTHFDSFVSQLVSLAQEGHEITSDLLKGSGK